MGSLSRGLHPCSTRPPRKPHDSSEAEEHDSGRESVAARLAPAAVEGGEVAASDLKRPRMDTASSSSSSSFSSRRPWQKGVRVRRLRCPTVTPRSRGGGGGGSDDGVQDLAFPLGMSFAAILAQALDQKNDPRERISVDHLSMICTSAVKESVTNIYGNRFDCFMRKFERSFGSTLKTLHLINVTSTMKQGNTRCSCETERTLGTRGPTSIPGNITCSSFIATTGETVHALGTRETPSIIESTTCSSFVGNSGETEPKYAVCEPSSTVEEPKENLSLSFMNNEIVLHGEMNQQLAHVSQSTSGPGFDHSILNTFERSVMEQTRSNDLKAVEIGLIMKKLQLKQSQLALSSYANVLEKIKISMGISKASFKEEKLRNQMQDMRHAEFVKRCIDILVAGLIIMSSFLVYGASIYSYQRITEVTSACTATAKESKSWWIPKPVTSFNSAWLILRCHFVALTRMSFGFLIILAIAYLVFQRSVMPGPTMPVTFILLMLGAICGFAGKLCIDTLGGSGYCWLLHWEALCLIHFFLHIYPSAFYDILYGPVSVTQGFQSVKIRYRFRRYTFYGIMLLILPTLSGLLPFASIYDWKDHFTKKIALWSSGNDYEL